MIKQFENLSMEDRNLLLNAPVLLSVLVSCSPGEVNKDQKADAIKLAHLKTFTADALLIPFYVELEKDFKNRFESAVQEYMPFNEQKREKLKAEIGRINLVLQKLNTDYANKLHNSFEKYERHVRRAAHSVFQDFIFPVPIPGLNE
jgi:hypothetical protein